MDKVCEDHSPLLVTRQRGKSVVIISKEDYDILDETAYLLRSPKNAEHLHASIQDVEEGKLMTFNSIEELGKAVGI